MKTLEEARAIATLVKAGKAKSYVGAGAELADFVLALPEEAQRATSDAPTKLACDRGPAERCEWSRPGECNTHRRTGEASPEYFTPEFYATQVEAARKHGQSWNLDEAEAIALLASIGVECRWGTGQAASLVVELLQRTRLDERRRSEAASPAKPDDCDCWGTSTCSACDPTGEKAVARDRAVEPRTAEASPDDDKHPDGGSLRFGKEVCPDCKRTRDTHDEWDFAFCNKQPRRERARLDEDGTAKPKTEIVGVFPAGKKNFYDNAEALIARPTRETDDEERRARRVRQVVGDRAGRDSVGRAVGGDPAALGGGGAGGDGGALPAEPEGAGVTAARKACKACSLEAEFGTEEDPHPVPGWMHKCPGAPTWQRPEATQMPGEAGLSADLDAVIAEIRSQCADGSLLPATIIAGIRQVQRAHASAPSSSLAAAARPDFHVLAAKLVVSVQVANTTAKEDVELVAEELERMFLAGQGKA